MSLIGFIHMVVKRRDEADEPAMGAVDDGDRK
jgi:hypothetical protein